MIAHGFSADALTTAASPGATARMDYSTHLATMLWPALVGRFALISGAWLGGLVLLHEVLTTWVQPQLGATSRLARAS